MRSIQDFLNGADPALRDAFLSALDAWANEVLQLRADTLAEGYDPFEQSVILDDLVGAYVARDRLERLGGVADMLAVRAVDELLRAVTREAGRGWLEMTGLADLAGQGWWWSRLPTASPVSDLRE